MTSRVKRHGPAFLLRITLAIESRRTAWPPTGASSFSASPRIIIADRPHAIRVIDVCRIELIVDGRLVRRPSTLILPQQAEDLPVRRYGLSAARGRHGPQADDPLAGELVEHQAIGIDPTAEALPKDALVGPDRFPAIDANLSARLRMHEPAERKRPVVAFDRRPHGTQVILGP